MLCGGGSKLALHILRSLDVLSAQDAEMSSVPGFSCTSISLSIQLTYTNIIGSSNFEFFLTEIYIFL